MAFGDHSCMNDEVLVEVGMYIPVVHSQLFHDCIPPSLPEDSYTAVLSKHAVSGTTV